MKVDYTRGHAETYDADYAVIRDPSGDRDFYRDLARAAGGPVLEIGCGTGRVLLPIANEGIECVGVDPSSAMLDVLRAKEPPPNLALIVSDAQSFDAGERRFSLVFAAFRVFQHFLEVEDQLGALANVRRHLAPNGRFAFDVFAPDLARLSQAHEPEHEDVRTRDGADEIRRVVWVDRDHARQVQSVWFRHERWRGGAKIAEDVSEAAMRWFFRYEIEHLLHRAGFAIDALFGGFDRRPYDACGEIIVVAKPRA